MIRARLASVVGIAALCASEPAHGWESSCRQYADTTLQPAAYAMLNSSPCAPDSGPNTARQRWIGGLDEHRTLFDTARDRAGLPASVTDTMLLRVFTSSDTITIGGTPQPVLTPSAFETATRARTRAVAVDELAQLPDFSYALWDWATGHETCPLGGVAATPEECHGFATHMGPVNANHFVPQAQRFYVRYHTLALTRARACHAMRDRLGAAATRFAPYVADCEQEALAIEAVAQHFLQDAWSTGHMWQRWGSPDLADFPGADATEQRSRAVMVALVSGLIHGSRGVLQVLPDWSGLDVDDALCAPDDAVQFFQAGRILHGAGDDYLAQLLAPTNAFGDQTHALLSCEASGLLEVYIAAGQNHGLAGAYDPTLARVDPTGDECFGQRATNRAIVEGAGIQVRIAGMQIDLPIDSRVASLIVPNLARASGGADVPPALRNQFRLQLVRAMSIARITAQDSPLGTQLADGGLGDLLGAHPNGAYPARNPIAPYADPDLPWPATLDTATPDAQLRALALARTFHRSHVDDWCNVTTDATLRALTTHARDLILDAEGHAAACEACAEIASRHLRVGTDAAHYDPTEEPVCSYLSDAPAFVYQPASGTSDPVALARTWCGCDP